MWGRKDKPEPTYRPTVTVYLSKFFLAEWRNDGKWEIHSLARICAYGGSRVWASWNATDAISLMTRLDEFEEKRLGGCE
jgi:hypothetical protein